MRPCDCKDKHSVDNKLDHGGYAINNNSIDVVPPNVRLQFSFCVITIPQYIFKRFAEWYLEDQKPFIQDIESEE
jgi:hypothetical protein